VAEKNRIGGILYEKTVSKAMCFETVLFVWGFEGVD